MTQARGRRAGMAGALIAATLLSACTSTAHQNPSARQNPSPRPSASSAPTTSATTSPRPSRQPRSAVPSARPRHRRHRHHHTASPVLTPRPSRTSASHPPRSTQPPPPKSTPPPPPKSTAPPPPPPRSTCLNVSVRVIPGGAVEGTEIAGLQFTNEGRKPCRLVGYPHVVLLKGGRRVGTRALPAGPTPGHAVALAPGQTVQSLLRDYSSCQAPLSVSARVSVPGESTKVVRPAQLRACTLRVSQLGPPR